MANIIEILSKSPEERKNDYKANGIDVVTINGVKFTDYKAFSFLWEKSYVKSPVRSADGTIGNLNSYSTFVTPHLKIDFSMMSIDTYRKLMSLVYEMNEFVVTNYDIVNNRHTTNKMYFSTEEMPKLWTIARAINGEQWVEVLGVENYTVEMIGTNASIDKVDILYYDNFPNGNLIADATQTVDKGTEAVINYNLKAPDGYRFDGVWKDETGKLVRNGDAITALGTKKLYALLIPTNQYTLSFNYGNGNVLYESSGEAVTSVNILYGETIKEAIAKADIILSDGEKFELNINGTGSQTVNYNGETVEPYKFYGWSWTTEYSEKSKVSGNTTFDYLINRTIHQIYKPKNYKITFNSNSDVVNFSDILVPYNSMVSLPNPMISGKLFVGWYTSPTFEENTKFLSGSTMPPENLTLYGKWL